MIYIAVHHLTMFVDDICYIVIHIVLKTPVCWSCYCYLQVYKIKIIFYCIFPGTLYFCKSD